MSLSLLRYDCRLVRRDFMKVYGIHSLLTPVWWFHHLLADASGVYSFCIRHFCWLAFAEHLKRLKWIYPAEIFRRTFAPVCGFECIFMLFVFFVFVFFRKVALCASTIMWRKRSQIGREDSRDFVFSKSGICRLVSFLAHICRSANIHICMRYKLFVVYVIGSYQPGLIRDQRLTGRQICLIEKDTQPEYGSCRRASLRSLAPRLFKSLHHVAFPFFDG